jgi:hypothetical protein
MVCGENRLVPAFARYGKTSRIPVLWISAGNDHFFGPRLMAQLTSSFSNAGGHLTYVETPPFGDDGHRLFGATNGIPIWSPGAAVKCMIVNINDKPTDNKPTDKMCPCDGVANYRRAEFTGDCAG